MEYLYSNQNKGTVISVKVTHPEKDITLLTPDVTFRTLCEPKPVTV